MLKEWKPELDLLVDKMAFEMCGVIWAITSCLLIEPFLSVLSPLHSQPG